MHTGDEAHFSPADEIGGTRARMTFGDVESKVDLGFIDRVNENASFYFILPKHLQCCLDALFHSPDWTMVFPRWSSHPFHSFSPSHRRSREGGGKSILRS